MARYFDGRRAAAHDVTLRLTDETLVLLATDGATCATWPLRRIVAVGSPDDAGSVTLAHDGEPARLVLDDPEMLRMLAFAGVRVRRERGWHAWHWMALIVGSLAALAGMALLLDAAPRLAAPWIPTAWEDRLGKMAEAALIQQHQRCNGGDGQQALDALVGRLRAAGGIPAVRIDVVNDATVNAFSLPGQRVVVMRGLIDKAGDSAELAGVIAHELGHVAHRDSTTLLLRQVGIGFVGAMLGWNDALGNAAGIARDLVTLSYSRRAEAAADAAAQEYLVRAGLQADGLGRFFARLQAVEGHGSIALLATHPPTEERRARASHATGGALPMSAAEWLSVRRMCD